MPEDGAIVRGETGSAVAYKDWLVGRRRVVFLYNDSSQIVLFRQHTFIDNKVYDAF